MIVEAVLGCPKVHSIHSGVHAIEKKVANDAKYSRMIG